MEHGSKTLPEEKNIATGKISFTILTGEVVGEVGEVIGEVGE